MTAELSTTDQRILAKLAELTKRSEQLEKQMYDPALAANTDRLVQLAKDHSKLKNLADCYRRHQDITRQITETQSLKDDPDTEAELQELAVAELSSLAAQGAEALQKAKEMLVMSDDAVIGAVIMEIRAGTGGEEAALFARNLYGMYNKYAEKRGWKIEGMSFSPTDMGGFREAIFAVKGPGVWQAMGYEGGGHRVQRVPETEAQGRIHTSAATVAVLPEPEALAIEIAPDDVVEHVSRSSGPGGQNVNKVSSAIKLEHIPTGITVSMQDEKSQHKNRAKAWRILRSRLYDHFEQQKRAERDATRKNMIGSGDRSQRIRTYNFPQNRVTDHRINLSLYSLDSVIAGEMDELLKALANHDKQQRLENI